MWSWWAWAMLAVALAWFDSWIYAGVAAGIAVLVQMGASVEEPPQYGLTHTFGVGSDAFSRTVSGATTVPFAAGNAVTVLHNGDAFYPMMLRDIWGATRSVTVEAYIYWAGRIGSTFAEALASKARSGVVVKILLDAVGSATIGRDILSTLEAGGCHIAWYNPIRWRTLSRFNHRTHRKSLIVDGRLAYTGGAGIADHWTGNAQDHDHWRDIQIRLEGPAVVPLQSGFAQNWLKTTKELITGDAFYAAIPATGRHAVHTLMSSPEGGASAVRILYYLAIVAARRSIYIANPYFVPDEVATQSLLDAKARGVDIRILVAGRYNNSRLAHLNSVRLMGPLLDAGIEIFEYQPTMMHYKLMVVDGLFATIGTTNFDNRSFAYNQECNVSTTDGELARQLQTTFLADLLRSRALSASSWRRRGGWQRAKEAAAALVEDQV